MRRKKLGAICMAAVMGASMMMSVSAMAQEDIIAVPYQQEAAWEEIALVNDDTVTTGVNIRSTASEEGQVIGCLYHGGAAWIINKGEEWTEVYSGGLTGFVKNEYLVYGEEAGAMAQGHGREGVATTWDDVKLYSAGDGNSDVLGSLDSGKALLLAEDGGHWLQVQNGADSTAYVSAEDVSRVLLLDTAVSNGVTETASGTEAAETYSEEETYTGTVPEAAVNYEETAPETEYYEDTYTENYTEDTYTETPDTADSYEDTYSEDSYSDTGAGEAYTETSVVDTPAPETESQSLPAGIGYYDEYTGTYYDYYGNPLYTGTQQIGYYDEYTGTYYDVYGNPMFTVPIGGSSTETTETTAQTEAPQTEAVYEENTPEETYVEEQVPAETEASSSSASSDDTSLLAALIYCEAGNQSYEGMVAVGAVVMNRVASGSFPNTISEVIYQSGQFTPAYSGALASALASGVPSACYEAAAAALNGENPVGGALYFNTGSGKGTKIGDHQFY